MAVIDIDDAETWPDDVRAAADRWAAHLSGTSTVASELYMPDAAEVDFGQVLAGHLVVAYHATRLLPHEVGDVREHGLRMATRGSMLRRIARAFNSYE